MSECVYECAHRYARSHIHTGTTDPNAPFGIVTLASSGSEGGPHMGAMRQAQTAGYGVLPGPKGSVMHNTPNTSTSTNTNTNRARGQGCFSGAYPLICDKVRGTLTLTLTLNLTLTLALTLTPT